MDLSISVSWAVGLALAVTRSVALVGSCAFVPKTIPRQGRAALGIAFGLVIAQPIASATISTPDLVVAAVTNVVLGVVLGWFLGLAITVFQVAGTVIDLTSGVSLGSVFDPDQGNTPGPFARFYTLSAQALIIAGGGLTLLIHVLWVSTKAIALDGHLSSLGFLGQTATEHVDAMFRRGVELALPIAAVLFVSELAFGLLSRLAPQINMFLISLPLKTLMTLAMLGTATVLFPRFADQVMSTGADTVSRLLGH